MVALVAAAMQPLMGVFLHPMPASTDQGQVAMCAVARQHGLVPGDKVVRVHTLRTTAGVHQAMAVVRHAIGMVKVADPPAGNHQREAVPAVTVKTPVIHPRLS